MLGTQGSTDIVAFRVGGDTVLFYDLGPSSPLEAITLQDFGDPVAIGIQDFI
ncbi:hypothetical protein ACFSTI_26275 [Rhizorhabdus histidinilytica]